MALLSYPRTTVFGVTGRTLPGAKLYVYNPGTSSLATVYSEASLTNTRANPVVADSAGTLPPVFVPEGSFKVRLTTSAGVQIYADDFVPAIPDLESINTITEDELAAGLASNDIDTDFDEGDVRRYGADPSGGTECSAAFQQAISVALIKAGGGVVRVPAGTYRVTTIDLTDAASTFSKAIRIVGDGRYATKIIPAAAGGIIVNAVGRNYWGLENIHIHSGSYESQCGILMCRTSTSGNANNNNFRDVWVTGGYSKAAVVSIGAESTSWFGCRFENTNGDHTTFWTGTDPADFSITGSGHTLIAGPNSDNVMTDCEFYAPYASAVVTRWSTGAAYTMVGCLVIAGSVAGARLAVYDNIDSNRWNGPMTWLNCQFEWFGGGGDAGGCAHYLAGTGTDFYDGINNYGGYYVTDNNSILIDYDRTAVAAQPVLEGSTWTTPKLTGNSTGTVAYLYGLYSSDVNLRPNNSSGTFVVTGLATNSFMDATTVVPPSVYTGTSFAVYATASPTSGTFTRGQLIWNTQPSAAGVPGWVVTASGTAGTLNGGATTGGITTGTNVLTVSTATGLSVGQVITIAGVAGAKTITKISGTTVYLGANANATVAGAAVAFSAPEIKAMAAVAA